MTEQNYLSKVFLWMFIGLFITFITGVTVSGNANALETVFSTGGYWIIIIAEFITVIVLSSKITKMSPTGAKLGFIFYSFLSGLTFSSIFVVYKIPYIISIFLITSIVMLIFSVIGAKTKVDLSKFGIYLCMALIGVVIASIINMFVGSEAFDLGITVICLLIFFGFVAYDVQKIKRFYLTDPTNENLAILGALELYLDFINIFIDLLRLFGDSNN
jgi:hypothetical protein